jgi:ABC-2 type transport system ATP-binding protein
VLRASALTKRYSPAAPPALDALDLEVRDGELLFLLGANGAGKTTTLNLFLDFTRADGGVAAVDGIVVAADPVAAKRRCALVPENVVAYATLTARQNLRFFFRLGGHDRPLDGDGAEALARAGLAPATFDRPVREFSKGMRQKLGIAIAVARDAPNLLLDEPTSGLDPAAAADFMARLAALRDDGHAILMCTHDVFRAREYADRAAIMRAGRLVATIDRAELRHRDLEALYLELMGSGERVRGNG